MSTLVNYALARCIIPAARYLQVASSINAGILPADESLVLKFDPSYTPEQEWVEAVRTFYKELSDSIEKLLHTHELSNEINFDDIQSWRKANGKVNGKVNWTHRVINEMMALRQQNGSDDLGEYEFRLIMRAVLCEF